MSSISFFSSFQLAVIILYFSLDTGQSNKLLLFFQWVTKLFDSEGDRKGNCRSGSVVDSQVINATGNDFYLQSHAAIQGSKTVDRILSIQYLNNFCFSQLLVRRTISFSLMRYSSQICESKPIASLFLVVSDNFVKNTRSSIHALPCICESYPIRVYPSACVLWVGWYLNSARYSELRDISSQQMLM